MRGVPLLRALSTALLLAAAVLARGAEPFGIAFLASPRDIYLHDAFQFTVSVQNIPAGSSASATFDTSGPADISGPSVTDENRIHTVNGRTVRSSGRTLTYRITPADAGTFAISNVVVSIDGRNHKVPGAEAVRVIGPEPSSYLTLSLSANHDSVLVDEPFEVSLDITIRRLPSPFQDESPITLQAVPTLVVPHLAEPPSDALQSQDVTALLNTLLAPRGAPGFSINGHTLATAPFGGGFMPFPSMHASTAVFAPPRTDALLNGRPAWNYRITTRFTAEAEGDVEFQPAIFRGVLITGVRNGSEAVTSRLFCESAPLVVHVTPPPAENRPSTFAGSVGTSLTASASLDAQSCRQGDPVRLTLDVTGSFSQRTFRLPPLADRAGFRDVFRVYESGDDLRSESIPNGLRFTWTLRPLRAGTLEIPPIAVAYYNTDSNAYHVARSAPVPLRVDEVPAFDPDLLFAEIESADDRSTRRAEDLLPAAITVDPAALDSASSPFSCAIAALLAVPPLFAAAVFLIRVRLRTRPERRRAARRRRAPRRVARALRRARTPQAALSATAAFFHDAFDIPPAAFTPADADAALLAADFPEETRRRLHSLLQPLYDAPFNASGAAAPPDPAALRELADLLAGLQSSDRQTDGIMRIIPFLVLLLLPLRLHAAGAETFLWEQANASIARAATPADFLETARLYRTLLDRDPARPCLLRNYGSALLLAERPDEALDAFLRAERLAGGDPDLLHDIRAAYTAQKRVEAPESTSPADLPWSRAVIPWHYTIPLHQRIAAAAVLWAAFWLILPFRRIRLLRALLAAAAIAFALIASSAALSYHANAAPLPPLPPAQVSTWQQ